MNVAHERIVAGTAATISFQGVDQDGEPGDPGTVTVGVVRSDGSTVVNAGTATSGSSTSPRTYALTAAQTATVDLLTATWKVGSTTVGTTLVEVVGGVFVRIADVRGIDRVVADASIDPLPHLKRVRSRAEQLIETETGVAWVPRFSTVRLDGNGQGALLLPEMMLRSVRWCRLWTDGTTYSSLSAAELAAIPADNVGIAWRSDGASWPCGVRNVEIGFEHGYATPNQDIAEACRMLLRDFARLYDNALSTRQTGFSVDGIWSQVVTASVRGAATSNPEVNAILTRHSHQVPGVA